MYALIDISNQMLEDSAFDMEGNPIARYLFGMRTSRLGTWC
jgi:hypothetical protein